MTGVHVPIDRRRIVPVVATALLLGLTAWAAADQLGTAWQLPGFLAVAALAVAGLVRRSTALTVAAVAASLAVTVVSDAVLPVDMSSPDFVPDSFGLVEAAALVLLLVQRWRTAGIVVATQGARVVAAQQASPPVEAALRAIEDSGAQALAPAEAR